LAHVVILNQQCRNVDDVSRDNLSAVRLLFHSPLRAVDPRRAQKLVSLCSVISVSILRCSRTSRFGHISSLCRDCIVRLLAIFERDEARLCAGAWADGSKDARVRKGRRSGIGRETRSRGRRVFAAGVVIACAALGGCSIPVADLPGIGLPANAPARSENAPAYLPVHDVPPPRDETVLTADEQKKIQSDLLNARDKQNAEANALVKSTGSSSGSSK
jgi:hypothetical protein